MIQCDINPAYHSSIYPSEDIIYTYQKYVVLVANLINIPYKIVDIIDLFCSLIINYKVIYKPILIENYV